MSNTLLPKPLLFLYALNGATLSLPSLALTAIVNDRAAIPVELLSAYGAVAFLPFSLKPLYGYLSILARRYFATHIFLAFLLFLSGVATCATAFVPKHGVALCFIIAFLRGLTVAFPEYLLGLVLISFTRANACVDTANIQEDQSIGDGNDGENEASEPLDFKLLSSIYQGQAATARNMGSCLATFVSFMIFLFARDDVVENGHISDITTTTLLLAAGSLPALGAVVAWWFQVGLSLFQVSSSALSEVGYDGLNANETDSSLRPVYNPLASGWENNVKDQGLHDELSGEEIIPVEGQELPSFSSGQRFVQSTPQETGSLNLSSTDVVTVMSLQLLLVWIGFEGILNVSKHLWQTGFVVLLSISALGLFRASTRTSATPFLKKETALFLVLKQAVPGAGYQLSSYMYFLFGSEPLLLQILSLCNSAVTVAASSFFTKFIACRDIKAMIISTTIAASLVSLLYITVAKFWDDPTLHVTRNFCFALLASFFGSFANEISFLPSVVLATASLDDNLHVSARGPSDAAKCEIDQNFTETSKYRGESQDNDGIKYGTYIACIDFGDQAGAW
eukprot:CAMPEP_0116038866 /NCGR_PEP_ID=MMETSP0321-20121206/23136_1 /TAXON_ID=163516 /ORGANISM="Leptocylindrus danicus var. danicus, Strain B650" /LENGTH=564 /DNA_ID=CAMNT_0003517807 /DNA_START=294 /DNA_END=1985 /DNA_ORIENTATION=-